MTRPENPYGRWTAGHAGRPSRPADPTAAPVPPRRPAEKPAATRLPSRPAPSSPAPAPSVPIAAASTPAHAPRPASEEQRLHGLNACLAAFAQRPQDLRKVWLLQSRIPKLKTVLAWCVQHRLGYRVVEDAELAKLTGTERHEGVCFAMRVPRESSLTEVLAAIPRAAPALLLWLDGVGNPHNLGAILRSAAHFGASAVLLSPRSPLALSGAAARVAEGGAEALPLLRLTDTAATLTALTAAGFTLAATIVRGGEPLFGATLPARLALVLGAEGEGVEPALAAACQRRLEIPGSGAVDSLNVSAATAVFLADWWRRHR